MEKLCMISKFKTDEPAKLNEYVTQKFQNVINRMIQEKKPDNHLSLENK